MNPEYNMDPRPENRPPEYVSYPNSQYQAPVQDTASYGPQYQAPQYQAPVQGAAPYGPSAPAPAKTPAPNTSLPRSFNTSTAEKVIAWLALPVAFFYVQFLWVFDATEDAQILQCKIFLGIFIAGFIAAGEILHRKEKFSLESVLWVLCEIAVFISLAFSLSHVWKGFHLLLFLHLFAPYWLLTRGHRLSEDARTSHMFFWDGLTAFFILPFKNFHLLVATIASTFTGNAGEEKKNRGLRVFLTCAAVVLGIILLIIALSLLSSADTRFAESLQKFWDALGIVWNIELFAKLFLTFLVGSYVFGMLSGSFRESKEQFGARSGGVLQLLERIKKVPAAVWFAFILLFSVFYILFFVLQAPYFVYAFKLELPDGYIYSEYAVQGLMELCGIMIVNFLLLWLATRTSKKSPLIKVGGTILLLETIFFAVIDFLKIFMYLRAYGFTPLRLQGIWLTTVLLFAAVCMLISLLSGKKTARIWFIGSAVSMVVLAFI